MTTNEELFCEKCNYYTNRKSDFKKHLLSTKHFNYINEKVIKENIFNCICGKHYTTRQNLWRHKQKCNIENINKQKIDNLKKEDNQEIENNSILDKTIMLEFIKQSQQFQKEMFSKRKL